MVANRNINNPLLDELHIAMNSSNIKELKKLVNAKNLNVRRALAKNSAIDSEIANKLASDPVLNVSYIASQHEKCTIKRPFDEESINHQCIQCTINENLLDCIACDNHIY
ncbi:MAG: hypothetical protein ACNI25_14705 [Halarcobacter sp.]